MRRLVWWGSAAAVLAASGTALLAWPSATRATGERTNTERAQIAIGADRAAADRAIAELRREGRVGHEAFVRVHREAIDGLRRRPPLERDAATERLRRALDALSAQRDAHASGLYWHTDLEAAQREARETGRPILSLRLLGRLDEEMSCANSRYFRIVLYPDPLVAARLRERYVLHWSSERPAPRITIDMGDGRRIERTITGNSVHYVLDARGRPVDAIVGLYAPAAFVRALDRAEPLARECGAMSGGERSHCLAGHHARALEAQARAWEALRARDPSLPSFDDVLAALPGQEEPSIARPSATIAMRMTVSKAAMEGPMLGVLERRRPAEPPSEPNWLRIGTLSDGAAPLEAPSFALLQLKTGSADVDRIAQRLAENAIADGARNELLFRRRVHRWFMDQEASVGAFTSLNERVYRELMLTPADDPWLGLRASDLYDGIELPPTRR